MTFLRRYGYGAIALTFLMSCFAIQLSVLTNGFFTQLLQGQWHAIYLNIPTFINADFCAGAVMISFGGVIGKLTPIQLMVMTAIEVCFYSLNEAILTVDLQIADIGGSMV